MPSTDKQRSLKMLKRKIQELENSLSETQVRLQEANETLEAIKTGAVDGLVRQTPQGNQIFLLKGSEEAYRSLIERMSEGAILLSENGTVLYCNKGFADLVKTPLDRVMGRDIIEWVSKDSTKAFEELTDSIKKKTEKNTFEVLFQTTEGKLIPTQVSVNGISLDSLNAAALIVTDLRAHMEEDVKRYTAGLEKEITERKKAEDALKQRTEQLEQTQKKLEENACTLEEYSNQMEELANERLKKLKEAERLAAIGATAGMVGHDIRNPLQAITSELYLARQEMSGQPDTKGKKSALESIDFMEEQVDYINKIVQDLQDYARPLNPKFEESDLSQVFEGILEKNGIPGNVEVTVRISKDACTLKADAYYLNRMMSNLITNAVQAMPQGGKLKIDAHKEKGETVITVQDTGVGIPKDIQAKMFTVMFTTKSKGQGFGLPVVKRMTESL